MGFKNLVLMFGGSLCAWMCGCGEDDDYVPQSPSHQIAILIVDDESNKFEGANFYHYFDQFTSYNLNVENIPADDVGYIQVDYIEGQQTIYKASQIFNGSGQIIVPDYLITADQFDYVNTNDFVSMPQSAIELTNGPTSHVDVKWSAIQSLQFVRSILYNNNYKIHYFKQNLNGGFTTNAKWVFIIKY